MEKKEVESKKKRDSCERRDRESYCPKKGSVASNVKFPIMKSVASIMKWRKYNQFVEIENFHYFWEEYVIEVANRKTYTTLDTVV